MNAKALQKLIDLDLQKANVIKTDNHNGGREVDVILNIDITLDNGKKYERFEPQYDLYEFVSNTLIVRPDDGWGDNSYAIDMNHVVHVDTVIEVEDAY